MSQWEAEEHLPHSNSAIISITEPDAPEANLSSGYKKIFRAEFDDIDIPLKGYKLLDSAQAIDMTSFIKDVVIGKFDYLIIHCRAGISRSSAVAAAILKHYNDDSTPVFGNKKYLPNLFVYRTLLRYL